MILEGKIAIVTGSSRGIGKAIALELAQNGANIVVSDIDLAAAEKTAAEISALGRKTLAIKANVADSAEVNDMIATVLQEFGQIDILVNNAGITRDTLILRMKEEDWDAVININLKGAFNCLKAVSKPMMKQHSGKIISISSVVGIMGNAGQANYAASKAGLIGLTKSAARELGARNITVNAVAPGFIETEMTKVLPAEVRQSYLDNIPLKRLGTPQEIAQTVLFLASPAADYITGLAVNVSGGLYM